MESTSQVQQAAEASPPPSTATSDTSNTTDNNSIANSSVTAKAKTGVKKVTQKLVDLGNPFRGIRQRIRKKRSKSAPPSLRESVLLEQHFRVDPVKRVVLPGVPQHDDDFARDAHDFFNLIVLIPIIALNVMNWNWDFIFNLKDATTNKHGNHSNFTLSNAWTGLWFEHFFFATCLYFFIDLAWILVIPKCVKSPATIIQHHLITLLYILLPYYNHDLRFGMGICMSVEINTWFLIARRVFNKQGFSPWIIDLSIVSIRVKLISIGFYITWIVIRCVMYPLFLVFLVERWSKYSDKVGTHVNLELIAPLLHLSFCILNFKWTYDLTMSKLRYLRRCKKGASLQSKPDKGL